jgi:hemerythrin-like domain-containing protein
MNLQRQVSRTLDQEHRTALELLGRVERAFAGADTTALREPELCALAATMAVAIEHEIARHFGFEEREIFPRLEAAGEQDIVALLMEEHVTIRAVAGELLPLARQAAVGTLDADDWPVLRRSALEMVERLSSHIEKETSGLIPLVEDVLDDGIDRELAMDYACA